MIRHEETTEMFRKVANKAWLESWYDAPSSKSYLEDLAGKIIDDKVTTGDELIDALVSWYGGSLERPAIDRFHKLDMGLVGMIGQAALVVSRVRPNNEPRRIEAAYGVGIVNGESLVCNLMKGEAYIPTEGHLSISGIRKVKQENRPLLVNHIYACGYDDEYRFLAYGTPNFAKQYTVDGRTKEAFEPSDYATPLDAAESREPHVQVFVGTDNVRDFFETNEVAIEQITALGANEQLEDLLRKTT